MVAALAMVAACGDGSGEISAGEAPVFGASDDPCTSTTLSNDLDDQARLDEGVDCFFAELDAQRPVIWDLSVATVEGDPILHRFDYDGDSITILIDSRADSFGPGSVVADRCRGITRTSFVPEGTECSPVNLPGFVDNDG